MPNSAGSQPEQRLKLERQKRLLAARRVVLKLGTSTVADPNGGVSAERLVPLVRSIARLKADTGRQFVLVSSGAVGLGRAHLGLDRARTHDLIMRQACAAVGQALLMNAWDQLFSAHGLKVAQVLLTEADFRDRQRYFNLRQTMERLLKLGVVPIVNENDTVSTAELEYVGGRIFSDNDRLAALVMSKLDADALVLLTNVDGLMQRRDDGSAPVIPLVKQITAELKALASGPSAGGRGGMLTKLEAAEIAMSAGGIAVIANGSQPDILDRVLTGDTVGTAFVSSTRMAGKRRWIAYAADIRGRVAVNAGARRALSGGKASLLSSGVVSVESPFESSDVISIVDPSGVEFARGIANCSSRNMEEQAGNVVLVTRNNIVLLDRS
ncbi:MAG: glutamate 5-kinase [Terriglobales bacterium]